ncbi:MAG TPA: BTAD domain-containing putative transcriptional regulator [Casimicrobiaceae bacterium]|jgi:tetratricopeptide (TPR) repeat protein|nr:BTAD domain-containing putative transcriptional regulator [Casimicrobiaceae bacterium]
MVDDRESSAGKPTKSAALASFERMLAAGKDSALLRYSIGNEHLKAGDHAAAIDALEHAVSLDATYTAAWKLYGSALQRAGRAADALDAYRRGIVVARQRGDRQAEKEMTVFARRIERGM